MSMTKAVLLGIVASFVTAAVFMLSMTLLIWLWAVW